jgi:hypothetical protein
MTMGRDGNRAKWESGKRAKWECYLGEMGKGEVGKGEMGRHRWSRGQLSPPDGTSWSWSTNYPVIGDSHAY